jgi:hypothetical protein
MTNPPEPTTTAIAPTDTKARKRMWPSVETASRLYDLANIVLILSLIAGVVSTALIVWMSNVKEGALRLEIATLGVEAAKANEAAERERVARLKIEARLAPRSFSPEAVAELRELGAKHPGQRFDVFMLDTVVEVANTAQALRTALAGGGWVARQWTATGGGFSVQGILVGVDLSNPPMAKIGTELVAILKRHGITASAHPLGEIPEKVLGMRFGPSEPADARIRILIGSK